MLLGSRSRGMIQDGMVECIYIYIYIVTLNGCEVCREIHR